MVKGWAFWRKDDDGPDTHLRFVISEPDDENSVLMVHMTTLRRTGREDLSCLLVSSDHPCVHDDSYIAYARARSIPCSQLLNERHRGLITLEPNLSPATLKKIQDGAKRSDALRKKLGRYFSLF